MNLTSLKWASTTFVLTGIFIAQFNIYPLYIFNKALDFKKKR